MKQVSLLVSCINLSVRQRGVRRERKWINASINLKTFDSIYRYKEISEVNTVDSNGMAKREWINMVAIVVVYVMPFIEALKAVLSSILILNAVLFIFICIAIYIYLYIYINIFTEIIWRKRRICQRRRRQNRTENESAPTEGWRPGAVQSTRDCFILQMDRNDWMAAYSHRQRLPRRRSSIHLFYIYFSFALPLFHDAIPRR